MSSVTMIHAYQYDLTDFPISPDLIIEGSPKSRIWIHAQSADKKVTHGVWDCTAGRFSWEYEWDEFAVTLEGGVTITPDDGEPITTSPGSFVYFPMGLKVIWQIDEYVKKSFTLRTPQPLEL
ncbi:MAG: hypothetical protein CMJ49_01340 [Planctomycetaceae bacterium]|nr:hypothetical protein [Planctomycetaceae bacterium]